MANNIAMRENCEIKVDSPKRFLNRELSWLEFNQRVLEEAENGKHPLLERLKFLSISASNLDEFYMVRVAGLKGQLSAGVDHPSADGLTPSKQLDAIRANAEELKNKHQCCWRVIKNELRYSQISISELNEITDNEKSWLSRYFQDKVFPVLTPMAVDPAHPFPFIPNLGFSMVLRLRRQPDGQETRALLPLPNLLDRFVRLPGNKIRFISLDNVISLNVNLIFPDFDIVQAAWFRVIRDTEFEIDEDAEDLMRTLGSALKKRIHGSIIKLSVNADIPDNLCQMITKEMDVLPSEVVRNEIMIGLSDTIELFKIDRPDLKFQPFDTRFPERVRELGGDCFEAIRAKDFIVHHPYESFDVVVKFIRQAASDPNVIAVKQTLYRTSNDSPTVAALIEAAEAGKSVTAMVELKARFDEEANIKWARDLERAGANVVFGFMDKKTHAKISLVVRREGNQLRSYAHFGTGNYHPDTARAYTDLSFFTCEPSICRDAAQIFNFMTGYTRPQKLRKLSMSPDNLRDNLMLLIEEEIGHAESGRPAAIWAKMNALVDPDIIDSLYRASNSGVCIDLIVRGICCLRPGVVGLSENITVKSIIGRFLEHSRIVIFGSGAAIPSPEAKVFITSADWMPRNLNWRVEVMVPIENPTVRQQVMEQVMVANFMDTAQAWNMKSNGKYERVDAPRSPFSAHTYFMTNPSLSGRGKAFDRHRPIMPRLVDVETLTNGS